MNSEGSRQRVGIIGGGLVGALTAIFLARRGFKVDIFEKRPDMRKESISAGRSINLAISVRGIHSLKKLGIADRILKQAVPMRGRLIHSVDEQLTFQPYGISDQHCIHSISRGGLNQDLLTIAEEEKDVQVFFNQEIEQLDWTDPSTTRVISRDLRSGERTERRFDVLLGADGAASMVRKQLESEGSVQVTESALDYGYKELTIKSGQKGMEPNALHIWPRGQFMLIALPNFDGSYTVTLFLPWKKSERFPSVPSFDECARGSDAWNLFDRHFPDALGRIDRLEESFVVNPTGHMVTVRTSSWHHPERRVFLIGDAAHAIVPFFGQGMNCGFEDCAVLDFLLESEGAASGNASWEKIIPRYTKMRKVNADAIADMAIENFVEMRDRVGDPLFLLKKNLENRLERELKSQYMSRYSLVSFSRVPYQTALEVGLKQNEILNQLLQNTSDLDSISTSKAQDLVRDRLGVDFDELVRSVPY